MGVKKKETQPVAKLQNPFEKKNEEKKIEVKNEESVKVLEKKIEDKKEEPQKIGKLQNPFEKKI